VGDRRITVGVARVIAAGAQGAGAEGADIVRAAGEELFYEGHRQTVAVGEADAAVDACSQHAVFGEAEIVSEVRFEPHILGERDTEYLLLFPSLVEIGAR